MRNSQRFPELQMFSRVAINKNAAVPLLAGQSVLASLTARAHFLILAPMHIILHGDPRFLNLNLQSSANLFSVRFRGGIFVMSAPTIWDTMIPGAHSPLLQGEPNLGAVSSICAAPHPGSIKSHQDIEALAAYKKAGKQGASKKRRTVS